MRTTALVWGIMSCLSCVCAERAAASPSGDDYIIHLPGRYCIWRSEGPGNAPKLLRQLSIDPTHPGGSFICDMDVISYAVHGDIVYGTYKDGHFILTTSNQDDKAAFAQFSSFTEWTHALRSAGIELHDQLRKPDEVARLLPDMEVRPWNYRIMKGLAGMSDGNWGALVWLGGACLAFVGGLVIPRRRDSCATAILLAIAACFTGAALTGGGPPAFACLLMLPPISLVAAMAGRYVRWFWSAVKAPRT